MAARRRGSGPRTGIYEPIDLRDNFLMGEREHEIQAVLCKIHKIYSGLMMLGEEELLLDNGGLCFGIMDPATNILVNTGLAKGMQGGVSPPSWGSNEEAALLDMSKRSLDGLIAFLARLFPYLPNTEALRFLAAADADPLVASCFIVSGRGMMRDFDVCASATAAAVEAALLCAAVAAKHPDPEELVRRWKLLSPYLDSIESLNNPAGKVLRTMQMSQRIAFTGTTRAHFELSKSWLSARRRQRILANRMHPADDALPPSRGAMKRVLLATIHGFYLQVLARLPTADPSRYYRSMLMGGYCYGPLDPVSNIIINTAWFELNFPVISNPTPPHIMISTDSLWRSASRSLYGLISFLCTRYPRLTPELAMQRLLAAGANLSAADPKLHDMRRNSGLGFFGCRDGPLQERAVEASTPSASAQEAYAAAAIAACHPNPAAQQEFLGSSDSLALLKVAFDVVLKDVDRALSVEDLDHLLFMLKYYSTSGLRLQQEPEKLSKKMHAYISRCKFEFLSKQNRARSMVEAALSAYNRDQQLQGTPYVLHVICGVNRFVSGPEFSLDKTNKDYNPSWFPYKYHHSHINFLATQGVGAPATLFFAECSNHGTERPWCVPVSLQRPQAVKIRCFYCEVECDRILHPAMTVFQGCGREFVKMLSGEPPVGTDKYAYTSDSIIGMRMARVDRVCDVEDDSIYSTSYTIDESDGDEEDDWLTEIVIC